MSDEERGNREGHKEPMGWQANYHNLCFAGLTLLWNFCHSSYILSTAMHACIALHDT